MTRIPPMTTFQAEAASASQEANPRFVVDPHLARLLEANEAGCALWGIDFAGQGTSPPAGKGTFPLDLDAAMPALRVLRTTPVTELEAGLRTLTFWTAHGALVVECRVRRCDAFADSPFEVDVTTRLPAAIEDSGDAVATAARRRAADVPAETIARLGHELRTPIAAILSLADVMAKGHFGPLGSTRYEDYARSIRETARHALSVIGSMLDPDAIGRPIAEQTFTEVDLNDLVADAVRSVEPMAKDNGAALDVALAPRLPRLIVDRMAVQQIVLNLLANGFEHAGVGAHLRLRTGGTVGGETWFEAEDDGPGIPARVIAAVTAGTAAAGIGAFSSTTEGGLGLRLIRALAEANGGRLEITDADPHGARVRIAFNASRAVPV